MKNLGIYIHIPFCLRKCPYCDFYSVAEAQTDRLKERFVKALCSEIEDAGRKYGKGAKAGKQRQADTVYFGGGTPSLLTPDGMREIMEAVRKSFDIAENPEISMECNPATASMEKLAAYRSAGINRLSIGAQSFDDGILKTLGRLHNSDDTVRTVEEARKAGFDNISLDLMFAIPGQTEKIWEETLRRAMELKPQHISFYSLEFMEGTPFTRRLEKGIIRETDAEADRLMYEGGLEILRQYGFMQYEISNAAAGEEYICRHNMKYWSLEEYLGFGPSAHSYLTGWEGRGIRFSNPCSLEEYLKVWENSGEGLTEAEAWGTVAVTEAAAAFCENSLADDVSEYVFTGLRKNRGIDLEDFKERFGEGLWDFYDENVRQEFHEYVQGGFAEETEGCIRLTVKGMNISNRIMALFV